MEKNREGTQKDRVSYGISKADIIWLLWARVGLLILALASAAIVTLDPNNSNTSGADLLYYPTAILLAFSAISILWAKARSTGPVFTALQLFSDVAIVTGIVYVTGGPISPFLFLYLPLVMAASILFSRGVALILAGLGGAAYALLAWALVSGWIASADGNVVTVPSTGVILQVVGLCSAMVLIAVATSFLVMKLRATAVIIQQSRQDLFELSNRQKTLVDSIPHGIITTKLDETIVSINQAACELLRLSDSESIGRNLLKLLREVSNNDSLTWPSEKEEGKQHEVELAYGDSTESLRIIFHHENLKGDDGSLTGKLFIFQDVTKLRSVEEQLKLQERMARLLAKPPSQRATGTSKANNFVGESAVMEKVFNLIDRVAPSDATVLVHGESGTGKELVAKAIHKGSGRAQGPFVPVNCGAIPENLLESELFGHKRGSFTGADSDSPGLFRQADGGTLFLDEIGELPLHMQTKLLRVIQEKRVRSVGGEKDLPIDVRIVVATNKNLKREVEAGNFREDLYYRLNVITVSLPPLRDRKEDIPPLTQAILQRLLGIEKTPVVSPSAMHLLMSYDYPGNVRELENLLERAHVLGGEVILPEHLPEVVRSFREVLRESNSKETQIIVDDDVRFPVKLDNILAEVERKYLEVALIKTSGAKKKAADLLGINFRSFRYRLQKFGISEDE